jgi:hypothetical protein
MSYNLWPPRTLNMQSNNNYTFTVRRLGVHVIYCSVICEKSASQTNLKGPNFRGPTSKSSGRGCVGCTMSGPTIWTLGGSGRGSYIAKLALAGSIVARPGAPGARRSTPCRRLRNMWNHVVHYARCLFRATVCVCVCVCVRVRAVCVCVFVCICMSLCMYECMGASYVCGDVVEFPQWTPLTSSDC